jgi:gliding motility-associated-like protein
MNKFLFALFLCISQFFFAQSDCITAITICGNSDITYLPSDTGVVDEGNESNDCLSGENHSAWYTFTMNTAGTFTFLITPAGDIDYDWALYGPNTTCSTLASTPPIRCSFAGTGSGYLTGLNMTATDTSEGAGGDGFVQFLNVLPGQTYYLLVDNYSPTVVPFTLSFGGTASLASPFNDPALTPNPFIAPGLPAANPQDPNEVIVCSNPALFNFNTLSPGIVNGNPNFIVKYYLNTNDLLANSNAINTPIIVNTTDTYYYAISYVHPTDPNNPVNRCQETGKFKFKIGSITATDATLTECNNNNEGTAVFNLTTANVINLPTATKKYYTSMTDLNANTNEITNPYQYLSAGGSVFVLVTSEFGCTDIAEIKLNFFPVVVVNEATIRACFIESNPSTGLFDLTNVSVTLQTGTTKKYYPSATDAVNQTNEILNPSQYTAPNGVVYVRVTNGNGCYNVAKVTLVVIPPVYSTVLIDKLICIEDKTTLDAGPGFTGYEWSTGATTQVISNVGVGTYWVKLTTGDCTAIQKVKVYATEQPVISNVEITNNSIAVNVTGGTPAYQYSLDNVNWQESNVFSGLSRGDYTLYVKDAYDCVPMEVVIVVPNIINVITPNGDGVNDVINYSALSGKGNLILNIYDRYGTKIHQADKANNFTWDGKTGGKNVPTGNYWYSVTWNENNKNKTPIKFTGWVMVKNRE